MTRDDEKVISAKTARGAQLQDMVWEHLDDLYPEFFTTEMDNGMFVRTLTRPEKGDIFEHWGKRLIVKYSWRWTYFVGIPVFCAELEPLEENDG